MDNKIPIEELLEDFGVENEDELYAKLTDDSNTIPCIVCGKEIPIEEIRIVGDDPYCKRCKNSL